MRRLPMIAMIAVLCVGTTACTRNESGSPDDLPPGDELVAAAAEEMRQVETARFWIEADRPVSPLALRGAEGVITADGEAEGTAQVEQLGTRVELGFVVTGDTLYLRGPTGGWQQMPLALAAGVYDPSRILDPDRGVAHVLATARDARTEGLSEVDGTEAYRVTATFDSAALGALVPGLSGEVAGELWIGVQRPLLLRADFAMPEGAGAEPATVTVTLGEFDAPVTVSAP